MDEAVQSYIDAIDPAYRPLFDRVHNLILSPTALPSPDCDLRALIPAALED